MHVASHWTSAPRYIRGHAQRPRPPAGRADGTTPPKKKCSTHFCIRIYYFKGSLKIKILYSIKNSFCLFFVPVNRTVPAAPGARDQLFPVASRRLVGQPGGDTRGCSASFGRGLLGRRNDPRFDFVGFGRRRRNRRCHGIRRRLCLKTGAVDTSPNSPRHNDTIPSSFRATRVTRLRNEAQRWPSASRALASAHLPAEAAKETTRRHFHLSDHGAGARGAGRAPHATRLAISGARTPSPVGFEGRQVPPLLPNRTQFLVPGTSNALRTVLY